MKLRNSEKERVSHHSVVLHVAGFANRLLVLHDIRLPSEDAVTVEAAEVLQMPVLALGLRVLIAKDQLWMQSGNLTELNAVWL